MKKSSSKLYSVAARKLNIALALVFPAVNIAYFGFLFLISYYLPTNTITKILCSTRDIDTIPDKTSAAFMQLSDRCIINDAPRTISVLLVLIIAIVIINTLYVRKILAPIKYAYHAQQQFSMSALHQMRTPMAVIRARLDNAVLSSTKADSKLYTEVLEELTVLESSTLSLVNLTQPAVKDQMSTNSIEATVNKLGAVHNVNVSYKNEQSTKLRLSKEDLWNMLDITLSNVALHSNSSTATVIVERKFKKTVMTISDEGQGFKESTKQSSKASNSSMHGHGLNIIEIIAFKYGGKVKIKKTSRPSIQITLPN
jgi:signal transduction histidine kinase